MAILCLPESNTPIHQLNATSCIQFLNTIRGQSNLPLYSVDNANSRPSLQQLRLEIKKIVVAMLHPNALQTDFNTMLLVRHRKMAHDLPKTNIWVAAYNNRIDEVKSYISNGISANTKETHYPEQTPLHLSVTGNQFSMFEYLLLQNANISLTDANENSTYYCTLIPLTAHRHFASHRTMQSHRYAKVATG